jgi:hypothetical protein
MKNRDMPPRPDALSTSQRVKKIAINVINPFSDVKVIFEKGFLPIWEKIKFMGGDKSRSVNTEELTFNQAVQRSGKSIPDLLAIYKKRQYVWTVLMFVMGIPPILFSLMILIASDLPTVTLYRALITSLIMAATAFYSYVQVLLAVYRHWQLSRQRVSIAEGGTFDDFAKEFKTVSDILNLKHINMDWK